MYILFSLVLYANMVLELPFGSSHFIITSVHWFKVSGLGKILGQCLQTVHDLYSILSMVINSLQASHLLLWSCWNAAMTVSLHILTGFFLALGQLWIVLVQMVWASKLTEFPLWLSSSSPLFFYTTSAILRILSTFSLHTWSGKVWTKEMSSYSACSGFAD